MWEVCPLCKGTGMYTIVNAIGQPYPKESTCAINPTPITTNVCPVCQGRRIIGTDGKPPKFEVKGFDEYSVPNTEGRTFTLPHHTV